MLISQLCSVIIFCFHLLSQTAADAGCLVCVIQQFALTDSDKRAMSSLGEGGAGGEAGEEESFQWGNGILNKSLSALRFYHSAWWCSLAIRTGIDEGKMGS